MKKKTSQAQLKSDESRFSQIFSPKQNSVNDDDVITMGIDQQKSKDANKSSGKESSKQKKSKTISKSEFMELQAAVSHRQPKQMPAADDSIEKTNGDAAPAAEVVLADQPEISILIMKNEVAEKIVSNLVEVSGSDVSRKLTKAKPETLPRQATVHFFEPSPVETKQIFLTEIILKDPIEVDFESIRGNKIAFARQSTSSVSTEPEARSKVGADSNVLETSFKVEKYFLTPKLLQKQFSIDEDEFPELETEVHDTALAKIPVSEQVLESASVPAPKAVQGPVPKQVLEPAPESVLEPEPARQDSKELMGHPTEHVLEPISECLLEASSEAILALSDSNPDLALPDLEPIELVVKQVSEEALSSAAQQDPENVPSLVNGESKTCLKEDNESKTCDEYGLSDNQSTNKTENISVKKISNVSVSSEPGHDFKLNEDTNVSLKSTSVSKDSSFEQNDSSTPRMTEIVNDISKRDKLKNGVAVRTRDRGLKSSSSSKDGSFEVDEIKKVDESRQKPRSTSTTRKPTDVVNDTTSTSASSSKESGFKGQTTAAALTKKYKKCEIFFPPLKQLWTSANFFEKLCL